MPLSDLTIASVRYATDADLFDESPSAFLRLAPDAPKLARGSDGSFTPDEPWILRSASVDFSARGVTAGRLVRLEVPAGSDAATFKRLGREEPAIVEEVLPGLSSAGGGLVLRRPGLEPDEGEPFGGAGTILGLTFTVVTYDRHIERATDRVRRELRALLPGWSDADLTACLEDTDLRDLTVYAVLADRPRDVPRGAAPATGVEPRDEFTAIAAYYESRYLEARGFLVGRVQAAPLVEGGVAGFIIA